MSLNALNSNAHYDLNAHILRYKQQMTNPLGSFQNILLDCCQRLSSQQQQNVHLVDETMKHWISFGDHILQPEHSAYCGHSKCVHLVTKAFFISLY